MFEKLTTAVGILPEDAKMMKEISMYFGIVGAVVIGSHLAMRVADKLID